MIHDYLHGKYVKSCEMHDGRQKFCNIIGVARGEAIFLNNCVFINFI